MVLRRGCDQQIECPNGFSPTSAFTSHSSCVDRDCLRHVQHFEFGDEIESLRQALAPLMKRAHQELCESRGRNREPLAGFRKLLGFFHGLSGAVDQVVAEC